MFATHIASAIDAARSLNRLNDLSSAIWKGLAAGALGDEDAQRFAEQIHARKAVLRAAAEPQDRLLGRQGIFPLRKPQRPPVRAAAIERRRRLAYSGPLPPTLAWRFTLGELACLRIIGDEVRERGFCALTLGAIAARAGCCRELAKRTVRKAAREGLIEVRERRRPGQINLPNVITVTSKEWTAWMVRGPRRPPGAPGRGIGETKSASSDTSRFRKRAAEPEARRPILRGGGPGRGGAMR
jgi:hypothetical protein